MSLVLSLLQSIALLFSEPAPICDVCLGGTLKLKPYCPKCRGRGVVTGPRTNEYVERRNEDG